MMMTMKRFAAALLLMMAVASTATAATQLPPGKWWRRPELVQRLAITDEQQNKLDAVFRASANDLIDLRADVEKQNVALRGELEQPQLNRDAIRRVSAKLNEARGRLFERELMMLVDMRGVLTDAQWKRMREELEQRGPRQQQRRQQQQQPQ